MNYWRQIIHNTLRGVSEDTRAWQPGNNDATLSSLLVKRGPYLRLGQKEYDGVSFAIHFRFNS